MGPIGKKAKIYPAENSDFYTVEETIMNKEAPKAGSLNAILAKLLARRRAFEKGNRAEPVKDHLADAMAVASLSALQTTSLSLQRKKKQQLQRINDAIYRCDRGIYGLCLDCEEQIDEARLSVLPEAEQCIRCREALEREERQRPKETPMGMDVAPSFMWERWVDEN